MYSIYRSLQWQLRLRLEVSKAIKVIQEKIHILGPTYNPFILATALTSQAIPLMNISYHITFRSHTALKYFIDPCPSHLNFLFASLQAQRKELFIQERYSRYNLSDPFLALQRDSEAVGDQNTDPGCSSSTSNPLVVLKLVVSHCRRMQEKMLAQLAAAESRHRRVGVDVCGS